MALLKTPAAELGATALDFELPDTNNRRWRLADVRGENATLLFFICNHCPYVKAIVERLVEQCTVLQEKGVGIAAVCSNDADNYPEDSFEAMGDFARAHKFSFPYLHDESQQVARAYGAVCTPDFFGYDRALKLAFRGRIDDCGLSEPTTNTTPELCEAMTEIAEGKQPSRQQFPSMGCSIKWK